MITIGGLRSNIVQTGETHTKYFTFKVSVQKFELPMHSETSCEIYIITAYQPCQVVESVRPFRDSLCPHHQNLIYFKAREMFLNFSCHDCSDSRS
jgi:hypothetical protein